MEIYNEMIDYENPLLSIKVFNSIRHEAFSGNWHYHRELEMLHIYSGGMDIHIDEEYYRLEAGDVIIMGPSQLHRDYCAEPPVEYMVLQFDLEHFFDQSTMPYMQYFFDSKHPLSQANYIFNAFPEVKAKVAQAMRGILEESSRKQPGYELAVSILVKNILLQLLRNDPREVFIRREDFDRARMKPVLDYIEKRLAERILVEDACKLANMSYYYFVKFFKKSIGISFTEYVNYRKIKWAERILLTQDLSVSEVGEQIGMPNMAHFYKMFKKYNACSPKEYQKKMLSWKRPEERKSLP